MIESSISGNDGNSLPFYINFAIVENGWFSNSFFRFEKSFPFREYKFVRNDRILYFFNNFDDYMNEEAQWIQSEKIKPRQKPHVHA